MSDRKRSVVMRMAGNIAAGIADQYSPESLIDTKRLAKRAVSIALAIFDEVKDRVADELPPIGKDIK